MKTRRIIALVLAVLMMGTLFAACSKTNGNNNQNNNNNLKVPDYLNKTGLPIVKEKITLTAMGLKDPGATEWNDLDLFKYIEEKTNIHFQFELAEASTYTEKKNLSLVGGTYPDMFLRRVEKSDEDTYGPQGTFVKLNDLITNYAPNLSKRMSEDKQIKAAITAMDGSIYGVPYYQETATQNAHLAFVSQAWLDNCGIKELPSNVDQFYDMLMKFKTMDANGNGDANDEIPWSSYQYTPFDWFVLPAFTGTVTGMATDVKDGKVVYTPAMPEYKEYLAYLNKLYSAKLIDPEFLTQTYQQFVAKVKSGTVGVYNASPTTLDPKTTTAMQVSLKPLTSSTNSKAVTKPVDRTYTGRGVITDKCIYPEAAMRWLDIWYATPEEGVEGLCGNTLFLGLEGKTWKYSDAEKKTYEFIPPITSFQDINKSVSVNMEMPSYLKFLAYPSNNKLMEMKVKGVYENQYPYTKSEIYPQNARYTPEESEKANLIEQDLYTYVQEMTTKFMTGEEPLSNFDKFQQTLKGMRLDEFMKIKTDAYERWIAATK